MQTRRYFYLSLLGLLLGSFQIATAQIPRTISYQAIIQSPGGGPISDGTHLVTFTIHASETGGTPLYTETQSIDIQNGLLNAQIGSVVTFPAGLRFDRPYWLGISIDGGATIQPRTPFTASPYALNAHRADSAGALVEGAPGVVRSLNGESGGLTLVGGGTTTVTKDGKTITISSTDGGGGGSLAEITNTDSALNITNGTGPIATINVRDGGIRGGMLADGSISPEKIDTAGAAAGEVLTFDGTSVNFSDVELSLPFVGTADDPDAFSITNSGDGRAGHFKGTDTSSLAHTLMGETVAIASWNGPAAVHGLSNGASGIGVFGNATGAPARGIAPRGVYGVSEVGIGVYGFSDSGTAVHGQANGTGPGVSALNIGSGTAITGVSSGTGDAGYFEINNDANTSKAVVVTTNGTGEAIYASRTKTSGTNPTIRAETMSTSNGSGLTVGATALYGEATATSAGGWSAGVRGINRSTTGNGIGVVGYQAGSGWGIVGQTESGTGVRAVTGDGGNALVAIYSGTTASTTTANNIAIFQAPPRAGGASVNQARIDATGKGYFNGGTVNSGADIAELFDVENLPSFYEPGDVMAISLESDRTITLSTEPYSQLVVGVYATKPGVLLTEEHIDADQSEMVPLGVIGVIPTKVCDENGPIQRGDILVSSSRPGYAMRADPEKVREHPGAILGKALENFEEGESGLIRVLVNVR